MSNPKEPTLQQVIELQFWQDVFKTALSNPTVVSELLELARKSNTILVEHLSGFADQSVKALRQRTAEQEAIVHFLGVPK